MGAGSAMCSIIGNGVRSLVLSLRPSLFGVIGLFLSRLRGIP